MTSFWMFLSGTIMMSGCGILTNGKGTRREYCEFSLDELQVCDHTNTHFTLPASVHVSVFMNSINSCHPRLGGRSHRVDAQSQRGAPFLHQRNRPRWDTSWGERKLRNMTVMVMPVFQSVFPKHRDDVDKCLVLSTTQRYLYCRRGVKKLENTHI